MDETPPSYALPGVAETVAELNKHGSLIANVLYFVVVAIVVIFLVHKLAKKFIYPRLVNKRHAMILIGTLHALVLLITLLLVLARLGFDVSVFAPIAMLVVLVGGVIILFIAPFLPTLPFVLGNMVEIGGVMGIVEAITPVFTRVRTFDGKTVFIPNAMVWAKNIINYHHTPSRRVELNLSISSDHSVADAMAILVKIMKSDERVLDDPEPGVRINGASAAGVDLVGLCWVLNADFLGARSSLYEKVVTVAQTQEGIFLSLRRQEVVLSGEVSGR